MKRRFAVRERFSSHAPADLRVSVITEAELRLGAARSKSSEKARHKLDNFLRPLTIIEFTSADAAAYAEVRARLEVAGTPIGPLDTLIGAQALSRGLTLVTNNEREFSRIEGLALANWASPGR